MAVDPRDDDGDGYRPSRHVEELLRQGDDPAVVEALIADVVTQRIKSHHADVVEGERFGNDALPLFIDRAPKIIAWIVTRNDGADFSIARVQSLTDELVQLDGTTFSERYGLDELRRELDRLADDQRAMKGSPGQQRNDHNPYRALAEYLAPGHPRVGEETIDEALLAAMRAKYRPHNIRRLTTILSVVLLDLGVVGLLLRIPPLATIFAFWPPALRPWPLLLAVVVIGVVGAVVAVFFDEAGSIASRLAPAPVVPAPIADWLRAHGMEDRLEHLNIYWSEPKRLANQRQFLGFIFCRRWPANRSAIEKIARRFQSAGIASF